MAGGTFDGLADAGGVAAHELVGTVDDELGCVDAVEAEVAGIGVLAFGEERRGEAIAPGAVPVVDVFGENDEVGVGEGLLIELGEEVVGGWATVAAFGSEELEEDGGAGLGGECEGEEGDGESHG